MSNLPVCVKGMGGWGESTIRKPGGLAHGKNILLTEKRLIFLYALEKMIA